MKNKLKKVVISTLVFLLLSFTITKCNNHKTALATIDALNSEITTYKLNNGKLVASKAAVIFDKAQLEDLVVSKDAELTDMYKQFSKVKTVTKTITIFKVDSVDVPFEVIIPCEFERSNTIIDKSYSFDYKVNQNGLKISNLLIPDSLSVVTGTKRKWFLGKETQTIDILHSNTNIETKSINHFEVRQNKKWFQSTVFKVGVGLVGGFLIAK
jgi:hypothetical protein